MQINCDATERKNGLNSESFANQSRLIRLIGGSTREFLLSERGFETANTRLKSVACPEITIVLGRIKVNALIDTGSKITCISKELFDKYSDAWKHFPTLPLVGVQAMGFTGEKSISVKKQFRAPLSLGCFLTEYNFLVVPKLVRECILGIDFQDHYKALINVSDKTITLYDPESNQSDELSFNMNEMHECDREEMISFCDNISSNWFEDVQVHNISCDQGPECLSDDEINLKLDSIEFASESERKALFNLIHRYREIFSKTPGRFLSYEYTFKMIDTSPFFRKSRPVEWQMRGTLRKGIAEMLRIGIIERSDTNYINPIVPVFKKDDTVRICLGAIDLNLRLQNDYDGPDDMDQVFKKCGNFGIMSSIDLTASYWQVPLARESRPYTGFLFEGRTYHFCVVPFGTKVSCAALSRAAEATLKGFESFLIDFADDWLCVSEDFSQHLEHLELLFERILLEGITINFAKVEFCRKEMRFLGYILTCEGLKPDPGKVQGIYDYPIPRNQKQLRGFLGVLNFSSRFTPLLSQTVHPLLRLLKKGVKWHWNEDDTVIFERVKMLFCEEVLLYHPSKSRPFILCTDSSQFGLGALLYQRDEEGDRKLICCASRSLRGSEVNYFTTELELLAIVWGLSKFRTFLVRSEVHIETDHKALTFLLSTRFLNDRLTRWVLAIQDYAPKITYVPGNKNIAADALSRLSGKRISKNENEALIGIILTRKPNRTLLNEIKHISEAQRKDPKLSKIIDLVKEHPNYKNYSLINDILHKEIYGQILLVLNQDLTKKLLLETHDLYGHIGTQKCVRMISEYFYFPNLKSYATRILRTCDSCQRNKSYTSNTLSKTSPIIPTGPRDLISIDFCGPLPTSRGGTKHILAVLDVFTKFVVLYAIKKADTRTTLNKIFNHYIPLYGKPNKIQSDHGTQFTAKKWLARLEGEGIKVVFSSIRHPQSNAVERINKEIGRFFRTLVNDKHTSWAMWLPFVQDCLNETHHDTIEFTPIELQLDKKPSRFWERWVTLPPRKNLPYQVKTVLVFESIKTKGRKRADKLNAGRTFKTHQIGNKVLVRACNMSDALSQVTAKFLSIYEGPYIVRDVYNDCTYKVSYPDSELIRGTFHSSALRPYYDVNEASAEEDKADNNAAGVVVSTKD